MAEKFITIKNEREIIRIGFHELLYVKVDGSLITCHIEDGKRFCCTTSLRSMLEKLPDDFILISRSCLVNRDKVRKYHRQKREVTLMDASTHKVSARKVKNLTDRLEWLKFYVLEPIFSKWRWQPVFYPKNPNVCKGYPIKTWYNYNYGDIVNGFQMSSLSSNDTIQSIYSLINPITLWKSSQS